MMMLRDPASAQFGDMRVNDQGVVCGTVNARNGFGGYTGHRAFYWVPQQHEGLVARGIPGDATLVEARMFEERGCSIGPEHERALEAWRILEQPASGAGSNDIDPAEDGGANAADGHYPSEKS